MTRWIGRLGTFLAIAGSLVFIGYVLWTLELGSFRSHVTPRSLVGLGAATLLCALLVPISALAWKRMLGGLGHKQKLFPLLAILATSQAGKYLPGNVGHHVGRVGLSLAQGIPLAALVASMAYEICLLLIAALLVSLGAGALSGPGLGVLLRLGNGDASVLVAIALAVLGLAAIPLLSPLLSWATSMVLRRRSGGHDIKASLPLRTILEVLGLYMLAMLLVGAGLVMLSVGLFQGARVDYALLAAAFALAWVVGFVTPGAPAGLGVREALLLLMLAPSMGAANASLLIIALRMATTLGDMLCFALGLAMMPRVRARRQVPQGPTMPHGDDQDLLR